jgi:hypothetical protein
LPIDMWPKIERWFGRGCGILFKGCTRGLPQLIFMTNPREPGQ